MSDLIERLLRNSPCDHADIDVSAMCREAADEIKRLRGLLEPCRHDTDTQADAGYPRTVNDVLSLLSAYIADFMPEDACPGDEYFAAWERQARKIVAPIMEEIERLRSEIERLTAERDRARSIARQLHEEVPDMVLTGEDDLWLSSRR